MRGYVSVAASQADRCEHCGAAIGTQALEEAEQSSDVNSPAIQRLTAALKPSIQACAS